MPDTMTLEPVTREQFTKTSKLLIIEDNRFERLVLRHILETTGFIYIDEAVNGVEGFEKIQNNQPDLIILDIEMPEMNGIEFCKRISSNPALKHIPIITQTGRNRSEDKQQIFAAGACDYVAKPIDQAEFIARIFSHLERTRWHAELAQFHSRVQDELAMASQTQKILIPSATVLSKVKDRYNIDIRHHELTCSELGGDFWGIHQLSDHQLIVYLIDFSGHGINAALNTFRLHTLMQQFYEQYDDPGEFLSQLNNELAALLPTGQFCTVFYGIINTQDHSLTYATASCPAPLVFRHNGSAEIIDGSGFLFGTIKGIKYQTHTIDFAPGDTLLLYSDALTESPDVTGNLIDEEQIIGYFAHDHAAGFDKLLATINTQYKRPWPDDLTLTSFYFSA
ncbi:MAG: fused response regulator/phosphatase [Gammaproteobacteria bacterium]|nr:fused response regulator/phosphatase [Gammaproteobacteria bacterium]